MPYVTGNSEKDTSRPSESWSLDDDSNDFNEDDDDLWLYCILKIVLCVVGNKRKDTSRSFRSWNLDDGSNDFNADNLGLSCQ